MTTQLSTIDFLKKEEVKQKFQEILGKNATTFMTTVMSLVAQNKMLQDADPQSVYMSAMTSASLWLPVNPNLWFAYILPYKNKDWTVAQFQLGYKWFIQLAQRSGQFKTISASPVYEGQLVEENPLTWYVFDWKNKKSDSIVGYAWYFSLINWFEKTIFMSVEELKKHGKKYSQTYKKWFGLWETDFDAMATKTVIKLLLSKFAPLSVEMQTAMIVDQWIIKWDSLEDVEYLDNPEIIESEVIVDEELIENWKTQLKECQTLEEVEALYKQNKPTNSTILSLFTERKNEITSGQVQD